MAKKHNKPRPGVKMFTLAIPDEIFNAIALAAATSFRDPTKETLALLHEALAARGVVIPLPVKHAANEFERITGKAATLPKEAQ